MSAASANPVVDKPREITQSLLYLNGVTVSFDGFRALNNLALDISRGEMRAIIGPNGAGKTTMMDVITGKTRPDSGEVLFDNGNVDLTAQDEAAIAQLGIGRKFQKPTVFENHTVEDNVLLALEGDRTVRRNLLWRPNGDADRIGAILATIGLKAHRERLAGALSHGQKQWLEIGMLIAQNPKLLLVDEPVAGMTPQEVERTAELLVSLAGAHSVVVVEHDMEFVRSIARNVTVLHEGSVLVEGTMDQVQNDQNVIDVYLGA